LLFGKIQHVHLLQGVADDITGIDFLGI